MEILNFWKTSKCPKPVIKKRLLLYSGGIECDPCEELVVLVQSNIFCKRNTYFRCIMHYVLEVNLAFTGIPKGVAEQES
jgi:hypothetical protein